MNPAIGSIEHEDARLAQVTGRSVTDTLPVLPEGISVRRERETVSEQMIKKHSRF